jgi:peptidoglycan hydrolase-like protein with peptidoglycan-binding domain
MKYKNHSKEQNVSIQKAVGYNSPNLYPDVMLVQQLLNKALSTYPRLKAENQPLKADGLCGSKTVEAIRHFQSIVMQFSNQDGVVEPNRNTWKKLNNNNTDKRSVSVAVSFQKPSVERFIQWFSGQINSNIELLHKEFLAENDKTLGIAPPLSSPIEPKKISAFSQADKKWGADTLGNGSGKSATIRASGCALVSLTMAATYLGSVTPDWPADLKPNQLDPVKANGVLKKAGAFTKNSYSLMITNGAKALGMKGIDSGRGGKLGSGHIQTIEDCLRNGGLVMLHVDYKGNTQGDHWVLLTEKTASGDYSAIDPAYGKEITFSRKPASGTTIESVILYGKSQTNAKNAGSYKVVRFVTLNAA